MDEPNVEFGEKKNTSLELKKRLDFLEKRLGRGLAKTAEDVKQFCQRAGRDLRSARELGAATSP